MGQWAEENLAEVKRQLGIEGDEHDEELLAYLRASQAEIEQLAGRHFGISRRAQLDIKPNGLPFVPVADLNLDQPLDAEVPVWPVPDPIHPAYARVLQVNTPHRVAPRVGPLSGALASAARFVAHAVREGLLTDAMTLWLAGERAQGRLEEALRWTLDPESHVHVPVAMEEVDGWWIQVSRRLFVVTKETPDDVGLVEVLIDRSGAGWALVASEPILIIVRHTEHPVDWAMPVRVWVTAGTQASRTWTIPGGAEAMHRYGLPVLSLDGESTAEEATAQILLSAYWHGYLRDTHEITGALVQAFPKEVHSIRGGTSAPDDEAAAARLFERLFKKGFDPSCSAETMRHYVRNHARTIVRAHRQAQRTDTAWRRLGISESYYYKLLGKRGVPKGPDGRFAVDKALLEEIKGALEHRASERDRRQSAIELLRRRGLSEANARKRVQRYGPEGAVTDRPRR